MENKMNAQITVGNSLKKRVYNSEPANQRHKIKRSYVKAKLYFLDGTIDEIVNIIPTFTDWSDPLEEAAMLMKEYVCALTRRAIRISKFEITFGYINSDGTYSSGVAYLPYEIPLNKVFIMGASGKWVEPSREMRDAYYDGLF